MWLLGRLYPDHKSIAEFRRQHRDAIVGAGADLVRFARECGLSRGEWVAIDGSKFRAVASIDATRALSRFRSLFRAYQLIRGILAAHHADARYAVLIDERRPDLRNQFFAVLTAVRYSHFRSRIALVTWQEIAATLTPSLQTLLRGKYGIG